MTSQARTKQCVCGTVVNESVTLSNKQWESKKYCSTKCKGEFETAVLPVKRIINLYVADELSTVEIGKLYGITHTSIVRLLKRNNIKLRSGSKILTKHREGIIQIYRESKSSYVVAEQYPYSRKTIDTFLKQEGEMIPRSSKGIISSAKKNKTTTAILNWR